MIRGNCYQADCPAREILGHVTGRWGGLVLGALLEGTRRYSGLRARVDGISEKMLAQTLRDLERDGLVIRRQHPAATGRLHAHGGRHGGRNARRQPHHLAARSPRGAR
jgi:DNA-binding HxlR family transcriptional regulator